MKTSTGSPSGCTVDITVVEIGLVLSLEEDLRCSNSATVELRNKDIQLC